MPNSDFFQFWNENFLKRSSSAAQTKYEITCETKDFERYFQSLYNGYYLSFHSKKLVRELFPFRKDINYCKCNAVTLGEIVSMEKSIKTGRAYFGGIIHCANPFLCPVCAPRIMARRSAEIGQAVHVWNSENPEHTCFLLTLTFQHSFSDSLDMNLKKFKNAREMFWGHRQVKKMFSSCGRVGRITAFEVTCSQVNGWHPHVHILIFGNKAVFDEKLLSVIWLNVLKKCGLSGKEGPALNLIEARSCKNYLQKISAEMALSNCKQGRGAKSFSPFQLLAEYADGAEWAGKRFQELFKVSNEMHLHVLQWSKGLKARFHIGEVADSDIVENNTDEKTFDWCSFGSFLFRLATWQEKYLLRKFATENNYSGFLDLIRDISIRAGVLS
jgi:hypothetical protein